MIYGNETIQAQIAINLICPITLLLAAVSL